MHYTDGQRQQCKLLARALAIEGHEAPSLKVFSAVEASALGVEIVQQLVEPLAPVLRAQHQQKVIAANVPDKVAAGSTRSLRHCARHSSTSSPRP